MNRIATTSFLIMFCIASWSQLAITADGKKVESADCSMNDVRISMPLPSNYKGYDLVNITLRLYIPEHGPGAQIGAGSYYSEYSNTFFEGKSTIDLVIASTAKNSDFKEGEFPYYALNYLDLEEICSDPMRKYTYITVVVSVRGAKHSGFEWRNGTQVKTYTYEDLNDYKFKYSLGEINTFYVGTMKKYRIDKVDNGNVEFTNYDYSSIIYFKDKSAGSQNQNESMDMGMGEPAPTATSGKVIMYSALLKSSENTISDVKSGVQLNLIATTNRSFNLGGYNIPFDHSSTFNINHVYWPVAGGAKPSTAGGEGNKFKGIGASSGSKSETKAAIDKIVANHNDYFTWTTTIIDGVEFQKLEIDVYEDTQVITNDAWACQLRSGEDGKTRKLVVLIGQKGDFIYCLAIFKSDVEGLTTNEKSFFEHVEKTFKFL